MLNLFRISIIAFMAFIIGTFSAHAVKTQKSTDTIPLYKSEDGLFVLDVSVNQSAPFPMILDTAASMSAFRSQTLKDLNVSNLAPERMVHGLIGSEKADSFFVDSIVAGPLEYAGPTLSIADSQSIKDHTVKGLLGTDFLVSGAEDNRYLLINFEEEEIAMGNRLSRLTGNKNAPRLVWYKFRSPTEEMNFLSVPLKVSGTKTVAIIDTGITFSVINSPLASKLEKRGRQIRNIIYKDVNGAESYMRHIQLGKVKTRNLSWDSTPALIYDAPALEALGLSDIPSILLGLNFLQNLAIVIDRKNMKIAFTSAHELSGKSNPCSKSRLNCYLGKSISGNS